MAALFCRNLDDRAASGLRGVYRINDLRQSGLNYVPSVPA